MCVLQGGNPLKSLVGFKRVHLAPGASVTVTFPVSAWDLAPARADGSRTVVAGTWTVVVGPGAGGAGVKLQVE